NRAFVGERGDDRRFTRTMRFLAVAAAILIVFVLFRRIWKGRYEPDVPPVPTDAGRVAGTGAPESLARRREEILQTGNYTEMVREYLQMLFASCGLPTPVQKPVRSLPDVSIRGSGRTTLREELSILWDVAFGPYPRTVN